MAGLTLNRRLALATLVGSLVMPAIVTAAPSDVVAVAAGGNHSCARTQSGYVRCWGANDHGQLGQTTRSATSAAPAVVYDDGAPLRDVAKVVAGDAFTCALMGGANPAVVGTVRCWGAGGLGQLGNGDVFDSADPVPVDGLTGVTALAAGRAHACAVSGGALWCWGSNGFRQLGLGSAGEAPLKASDGLLGKDSVAVGTDGSAYASDSTAGVVWSFDAEGLFRWRATVTRPGALAVNPVATAPGELYVADYVIAGGSPALVVHVLAANTGVEVRTRTLPIAGCGAGHTCDLTAIGVDRNGTLIAGVVNLTIATVTRTASLLAFDPAGAPAGSRDVTADVTGITDVVVQPNTNNVDEVYALGSNERVAIYPPSLAGKLGDFSVVPGGAAGLCAPEDSYSTLNTVGSVGAGWDVTYKHRVGAPAGTSRMGPGRNRTLALAPRYQVTQKIRTVHYPPGPQPTDPPPLDTGALPYTPAGILLAAPVRCAVLFDPAQGGAFTEAISAPTGTDASLLGLQDVAATPDGGLVAYDSGISAGVVVREPHLVRSDALGLVEARWGDVSFSSLPRRVGPIDLLPAPHAVTAVAAGRSGTCATLASGANACWGSNGSRQFGYDPGINENIVQYGADPTVTSFPVFDPTGGAAALGAYHACTSRSGLVLCRGDDTWEQTSFINGLSGWDPFNPPLQGQEVWSDYYNPTADELSAGDLHTCDIHRTDSGSVSCWGSTADGRVGGGAAPATCLNYRWVVYVGEGGICSRLLLGATQISAGRAHTCAVAGAVAYCWGSNRSGEVGDPVAPFDGFVPFAVAKSFAPDPPTPAPVSDSTVLAAFAFPTGVEKVTGAAVRIDDVTVPAAPQPGPAVASIACSDADHGAVSCVNGPVWEVAVHPAGELLPGADYRVTVNGDATSAASVGGVPVPPATGAGRGPNAADEMSRFATYRWGGRKLSKAFGGSVIEEDQGGATATFPFTGAAITWMTVAGKDQGIASVSIDGGKPRLANNYAKKTKLKKAIVFKGLAPGAHTIRITVTGRAGARKAKGALVTIDAFKVGAGIVPSPVLATSWAAAPLAVAGGGTLQHSGRAGATASFEFGGTTITVRTLNGPDQGDATILVDGVKKAVHAGFAATTTAAKVTIGGLPAGRHVVSVVAAGTGKGKLHLVSIDGFEVG